jgi:hypothetical protein
LSLILREELRLMVFENRVLRRMFEPTKYAMTGCWRKIHKVEIHIFWSLHIIGVIQSRRVKWVRHVARMEREEEYVEGFGGKREDTSVT